MSKTTTVELRHGTRIVITFPNGKELDVENDELAIGPLIGSLRVADNAGVLKDWVEPETIERLLKEADVVDYDGSTRPGWSGRP